MKPLRHRSLQTKLVLAFAAALLPILLLMLWGFRSDVRHSQERILEYEQLAAEAVAMQVEETFDAALGIAWAAANDPVVQTLDVPRVDAHLEMLIGRHPMFESISVFDASGENRGWGSQTGAAEPRLNIADRSFFQTVMGTNAPAISDVVDLKRPAGVPGIVVGVPLRNARDEVTGVVAVAMTTTQLSKRYEESRLRPGYAIFLTDRMGQLGFHSSMRHLGLTQSGALAGFDPIRKALSGTPQTVAKYQSPLLNDVRIGAFVPTPKYHWVVGVTMPRDIALAPVNATLRRQIIGLLATVLLSGLIATLLAMQLTSPLARLREHAKAIGKGKLARRVTITTGDEFEEVGEAFNEMAQQIQTRDAHLRASEERFRATFEQAAVGIAHATLDGYWLWVNDRLCEILGYSREEFVQKTFQEITHPDDVSRDVARSQDLLAGRFQKYALEKRCRHKNGSFIWVNSTVTLVRHPDGSPAYFIAVVEDIQRRKQMEEDRQQLLQREQSARAAAEAANRAKDQLLSTVSHELRTPLTPVLAGLDLLDQETVSSEEGRSCLQMIRGNIEMEARLVGDLLDLTRIQQSKLHLHRATADVHDLLRHLAGFFEHEIKAKNLDLKLVLDAQQHFLFADPERLQQVFWNLVSNAVKYTPAGGHITIHSRNESDLLKITVTDTGIGITPEVMSRLFDAFEQGEQTLTRRYGGLGLGLAISKALVEMHGGQLTASSDGADKGAVFTVALPLTKAEENEPSAPVSTHGRHPGSKCRILLVEDNPDTQKTLARLLQKGGHVVRTASSVSEALGTAQGERFDLLVSDIGLPDASGWELLRQLKKIQSVPAIAISGFGTPEDQQKSREAGFKRHLVKPINFQALRDVIDQVADGACSISHD